MNIQIFGTKKCNETKKAQRYFKERNIKFQFIDMSEKEISKGEFRSVWMQARKVWKARSRLPRLWGVKPLVQA